MRSTAALLATLTTLALGCGGEVIVPSQSSDSGSGSGSGGASATASSTASTGGAGGSVVASSSTGAPPPTCNNATVFVDILGDGANQHYDASCAPEGHLSLPGGAKTPPSPGGSLTITTCPLAANQILVLYGASGDWPAAISDAMIIYYHDGAEYDVSPAQSGALEIVTFEPVGGVIEGAFTATVAAKDPSGNPNKIQITGKFRVCRGADWVPV
ncbi:MAG: hypothetical protein ABJE95_37220 [Byssovorax sp.]